MNERWSKHKYDVKNRPTQNELAIYFHKDHDLEKDQEVFILDHSIPSLEEPRGKSLKKVTYTFLKKSKKKSRSQKKSQKVKKKVTKKKVTYTFFRVIYTSRRTKTLGGQVHL